MTEEANNDMCISSRGLKGAVKPTLNAERERDVACLVRDRHQKDVPIVSSTSTAKRCACVCIATPKGLVGPTTVDKQTSPSVDVNTKRYTTHVPRKPEKAPKENLLQYISVWQTPYDTVLISVAKGCHAPDRRVP